MVTDYITPALGTVVPCMGEWEDGQDEGAVEFLSINLEGALRPGVISQTNFVDFWYVSKRDQADMIGGKKAAMETALGFMQYISDHKSSSCFANVIPITGIIGPKATEQKRLAFKFTVEFTS
jgi:hypothetical protein